MTTSHTHNDLPPVDEFLLAIVRGLRHLAHRSETHEYKRGRLQLENGTAEISESTIAAMQAANNNLNREAA